MALCAVPARSSSTSSSTAAATHAHFKKRSRHGLSCARLIAHLAATGPRGFATLGEPSSPSASRISSSEQVTSRVRTVNSNRRPPAGAATCDVVRTNRRLPLP
eukprot:scaffold8850_cov134-Isochrysis_galbana.AAC.7